MILHTLWTRAVESKASLIQNPYRLKAGNINLPHWYSAINMSGMWYINWINLHVFIVYTIQDLWCDSNVRGYLNCCIIKHYLNIKNHRIVNPGDLGGLHQDIIQSREPRAGCKMDGEDRGEAVQLGLFKREMDRGSEQGTNIPLQRAHNSASICTPLSLPSIHHSLTVLTSIFYLTSHRLCFFLRHKSSWDSAVS